MIPILLAQAAQAPDGMSILNVITSLGASTAAVVVVWIFIGYLRTQDGRNSEILKQYEDLARDKGQVIRDNTVAMRENTLMVQRLEQTVKEMSVVVHEFSGRK
jgi:ammonia channel protein AmtB